MATPDVRTPTRTPTPFMVPSNPNTGPASAPATTVSSKHNHHDMTSGHPKTNSGRNSISVRLISSIVSCLENMKSLNFLLVTCLLESVLDLGAGDLRNDIQRSEQSHLVAHSRKRRYVVFPEGSTLTVATSLQVAACVSPTALSGAGAIFTSGLAWALSYDLPNETIHTKDNKYEFPVMIRRHKRDLFVRMEKLMDSAGIDGKSCVLKTICETAQQLLPRQGILEEILRVLFTYPPEEKSNYNWLVNKQYVKAHVAGESHEDCNDLFPCPISLLELGLGFGKYPQSYL